MPIDGSDKCPICIFRNYREACRLPMQDAFRLSCDLCGTYDVSGTARASLQGGERHLRPYLSAFVRQTWELEGRIPVITSKWETLAEIHEHTSVHQKADKLLRVIEQRTREAGEFVTIDLDLDYPLVDAKHGEPLLYLLKYWEDLGCIERKTAVAVRLTVAGWDRLDSASSGGGIAGRVFVAMAFDESLDEMYEHGIKRAIEEDCRMTPIRIDRLQPNKQKICDRILAEIRRSRILVADFTKHRPGVYFEAGFALALGRLVIWTCREDEIDQAHFDTRQYPHLLWKDAEDLRMKLSERIQREPDMTR